MRGLIFCSLFKALEDQCEWCGARIDAIPVWNTLTPVLFPVEEGGLSVSSAQCKSICFLKPNFILKSITVSIKMNRQQRFLKIALTESEPWISNILRTSEYSCTERVIWSHMAKNNLFWRGFPLRGGPLLIKLFLEIAQHMLYIFL